MKNDIVIRDYQRTDFYKIIKGGYTFSPFYLKKSFKTILFEKLMKYLNFFDNFTRVAYQKNNMQILGCCTNRKFRQHIWLSGPIFVNKNHRRQNIGTLLLEDSIKILKRNKIPKVLADIPINNPSLKLYHKVGFKNLGHTLYIFGNINKKLPKLENISGKIKIVRKINQNTLLKIFNCSVTEKWKSFFELNNKNFLIPLNLTMTTFPSFFFKRTILTINYKANINGFGVIYYTKLQNFLEGANIQLFLSGNHNDLDSQKLFKVALRILKQIGIKKLNYMLYGKIYEDSNLKNYINQCGLTTIPHITVYLNF